MLRLVGLLLDFLFIEGVLFLIGRFLGQLFREVFEEFFDPNILLGTDFVVLETQSAGVVHGLVPCDLVVFKIYFVADDDYADVCVCLLIQLLDPLLALLEAFPVGDIENYTGPNGVLIVHLS